MAIRSRKNQYRGINAHLHSRLQNVAAGWEPFHGKHIGDLAEAIDPLLPPGYLVDFAKSMQIHEDEEDDEMYLRALVIRHINDEDDLGTPVTWIELLSPTNKPGGTGALQYREKRIATLHSGLVLVEMDYLHQTLSPISRLPSYPDGEAGAFPYTLVVTDPRPTLELGKMDVYGFVVDEPLPIINIPLADDDSFALDFDAAYQKTFASLAAYSQRVDYASEPERFDSYSADDQGRIRDRMAAVMDAERAGLDLESGSFAVEEFLS